MRLIPRDERFFDLFAEIAVCLTGSATRLSQLFAEPDRLTVLVAEIKELEHKADQLTHSVNVRIDSSFVTPLDREDIHLLVTRLDNVVDLIDGTARRAVMFNLTEYREPARKLADCIVKAASEISQIIGDMKKPKEVSIHAREIKRLEEEGDALYFDAVGALFRDPNADAIDVMKWKEMYDKLEDTLDECENVSNVLESISIKNA